MRKASEKPLLTLIEAGGVNNMPVVVEPAVATSPALIEALEAVKAAGYRVVKPRKPETLQRNKKVGPTFVAAFIDGTVTRMSTCTSLEKLDVVRGIKLSHAAYYSRLKKPAPRIVAARFEDNGRVLARYGDGALQLSGATAVACPGEGANSA
jgi:hypothetical protein